MFEALEVDVVNGRCYDAFYPAGGDFHVVIYPRLVVDAATESGGRDAH